MGVQPRILSCCGAGVKQEEERFHKEENGSDYQPHPVPVGRVVYTGVSSDPRVLTPPNKD